MTDWTMSEFIIYLTFLFVLNVTIGYFIRGKHDLAVVLTEREECARVCEDQKRKYEERASNPDDIRDINKDVARIASMTCAFNAAAIRSRGQQ